MPNMFEGLGDIVKASVPQQFSFNLDQLVALMDCVIARQNEIEDRELDGDKQYSFYGTPLKDVLDSIYNILLSYRFS